VADTVGERIGLPRSGASDDEKRTCDIRANRGHAVLYAAALL
jgi:hypothetical protein